MAGFKDYLARLWETVEPLVTHICCTLVMICVALLAALFDLIAPEEMKGYLKLVEYVAIVVALVVLAIHVLGILIIHTALDIKQRFTAGFLTQEKGRGTKPPEDS